MEGWSAFLFTLGGLCMGWALTQATEWLRRKDEYQRTYKEVLSYLLDMYHLLQVLRVDVKPALRQIVSKMAAQRGEKLTGDEIEARATDYSFEQLQQRMESLIGPRLMELKAGYGATVQKLASIDPVLAYSLRNQDDFLSILDQVRDMVVPLGMDRPEQLAMAKRMFDTMAKPQVFTATSDKVRKMIVAVSKKLDRPTKRNTMTMVNAMEKLKDGGGTNMEFANRAVQLFMAQAASASRAAR
jgi:hypothetical protein